MVREVWAHFSADENYFTKDGKRYPYEEGMGPYEYLMGALSGCFASTLRDEMEEEGVSFSRIELHTWGIKRDAMPSTLKETHIEITVVSQCSRKSIEHCVIKAQEHCSMYQTVKCVSDMHVDLEVKE